jgi:hypothetical protein
MPIFVPSSELDEQIILDISAGICDYWNKFGGTDFGIRLFVSKDSVRTVSQEGGDILAAHFAEQPGPFKRVAAFLVASRLSSLFTLATVNSTADDLHEIPAQIELEWLPKVCFLLLGPAFSIVHIDGHDKKHTLDDWKGFPSIHTKAEFLFWLRWLCEYRSDCLPAGEVLARRGRMVLATSLILEAVYYQMSTGAVPPLCGLCDVELKKRFPDFRQVVFDGWLSATEQDYEKNTSNYRARLDPLI